MASSLYLELLMKSFHRLNRMPYSWGHWKHCLFRRTESFVLLMNENAFGKYEIKNLQFKVDEVVQVAKEKVGGYMRTKTFKSYWSWPCAIVIFSQTWYVLPDYQNIFSKTSPPTTSSTLLPPFGPFGKSMLNLESCGKPRFIVCRVILSNVMVQSRTKQNDLLFISIHLWFTSVSKIPSFTNSWLHFVPIVIKEQSFELCNKGYR